MRKKKHEKMNCVMREVSDKYNDEKQMYMIRGRKCKIKLRGYEKRRIKVMKKSTYDKKHETENKLITKLQTA